jgi:hypothetical protein
MSTYDTDSAARLLRKLVDRPAREATNADAKLLIDELVTLLKASRLVGYSFPQSMNGQAISSGHGQVALRAHDGKVLLFDGTNHKEVAGLKWNGVEGRFDGSSESIDGLAQLLSAVMFKLEPEITVQTLAALGVSLKR